jgi:hypothetical protein
MSARTGAGATSADRELVITRICFETVTARDLHRGGWTSALECLADYWRRAEADCA